MSKDGNKMAETKAAVKTEEPKVDRKDNPGPVAETLGTVPIELPARSTPVTAPAVEIEE